MSGHVLLILLNLILIMVIKNILVIWNNKTSDTNWMYWLTERNDNSDTQIPKWYPYLLDIYHIINKYNRYKLNPKNNNLFGIRLGEIYNYVTGNKLLQNAHNSLIDTQGQLIV